MRQRVSTRVKQSHVQHYQSSTEFQKKLNKHRLIGALNCLKRMPLVTDNKFMRLGALLWAIAILVHWHAYAGTASELNKSYATLYAQYQDLLKTQDSISPNAFLNRQANLIQNFQELLNQTISLNSSQHDKNISVIEARLWFALGNLWYQKKPSSSAKIEAARYQDVINAFEQSLQLAKASGLNDLAQKAAQNRDAAILASKQNSSELNQIKDTFDELAKHKPEDLIKAKTVAESASADSHNGTSTENITQGPISNSRDIFINQYTEKMLATLTHETKETQKKFEEINQQREELEKKIENEERDNAKKFFEHIEKNGINNLTETNTGTLPFFYKDHESSMGESKAEPISNFYITPPGTYKYLDMQSFHVFNGHRWNISKEAPIEIKIGNQKLGDTLLKVATVKVAPAPVMDLVLPAVLGSSPDLTSLHFLGDIPKNLKLTRSTEGTFVLHLEFSSSNQKQGTQFSYLLKEDLEPHLPTEADISKMGAIFPEILNDLDGPMQLAKNNLEKSQLIKKYLNEHGFYSTSKAHSNFINTPGTNKITQLQRVLLQIGPENLKPLGMDCDVWAELGIALLRHYGVPSQLVTGLYDSSSTGKLTSKDGHGWARIFDGHEWQNQDMTASRGTPDENKHQSHLETEAIEKSQNKEIQEELKVIKKNIEEKKAQEEYLQLAKRFYESLKDKKSSGYATLKNAESIVEGFKIRENIILNALQEQQKITELSQDPTKREVISSIQKKQADRIESILDLIEQLSPDSYYRAALIDALHTQMQVYFNLNQAQNQKSKIWVERANRFMREQKNHGVLNLYAADDPNFNPSNTLFALGPFLIKNSESTAVPHVVWASSTATASAVSPIPENQTTQEKISSVTYEKNSNHPLVSSLMRTLDNQGTVQSEQHAASFLSKEKKFLKTDDSSQIIPLKNSGFIYISTPRDATTAKARVEFLDSNLAVDHSKTLNCESVDNNRSVEILSNNPLRFYCIKKIASNRQSIEFYEEHILTSSYPIEKEFEMMTLQHGSTSQITTIYEPLKKQRFLLTTNGLITAPHNISLALNVPEGKLIFFRDSDEVGFVKNNTRKMSIIGKTQAIMSDTIQTKSSRNFWKIVLPNGQPYKIAFQDKEYRLMVPNASTDLASSATIKDGDIIWDSFSGPNQSLQYEEGKRVYLEGEKIYPFSAHNEIGAATVFRFSGFDPQNDPKRGTIYIPKETSPNAYQVWAEQNGRRTDISFRRFPTNPDANWQLDPAKSNDFAYLGSVIDPTYGQLHMITGNSLDGYPFEVNSVIEDSVKIGFDDIGKKAKNYARSAALVMEHDPESFEAELAPNATYLKQISDPSLRLLYLSRNYLSFARYLEKPANPWMSRAEQMMQSEVFRIGQNSNWHQVFSDEDLLDLAQNAYSSQNFSQSSQVIAQAVRDRDLGDAFMTRLYEEKTSLGLREAIPENTYKEALGSRYLTPDTKSSKGIMQKKFLQILQSSKE